MDHLKSINAQQANTTYAYKNTKGKLHRYQATIWFNKMCQLNHLTPKCIKITINGYGRQCQNTTKAATTYRINQELKFLYKKKQTLNGRLCHLQLQCHNQWPSTRNYIQTNIDEKLQVTIDKLYQTLNKCICCFCHHI
jgi:hypothetical protein